MNLMRLFRFFTIVPEKNAYIIERFGRFHKICNPGFSFLVPIIDNIPYKHSLKELAINIEKQQAITRDNVTLEIDGILFVRIDEPYKASYNIEKPLDAVKLLALTVLRSEIGKISLDQLFQERAQLNKNIVKSVLQATTPWGMTCLRYEILNIEPPEEIRQAMQYEAEAERLKRREILISEGKKQAEINLALGTQAKILNNAEGDAESLKIIAEMESQSIKILGKALESENGTKIIDYLLTKDYLSNYKEILKNCNVMICPEKTADDKSKSSESDLITLAAMMMMSNNNMQVNSSSFSNTQKMQAQGSDKSGQERISQQEQVSTDNYDKLLEKINYYDEPILYSSDDEKKQNTDSKNKKLGQKNHKQSQKQ